jgi:hypothetical protein
LFQRPRFEELSAQLDEAKVLRSSRVPAVQCGPILPSWRTPKGSRRWGLATHQVVDKIPHVAVPARPINANLRCRADDRLAEVINADLASVAAAAGTRAAGRHEGRVAARC